MPTRAADLETRLYVQDREFNRGLQDAERRAQRFARNVNSEFGKIGSDSAGGGGGFGFGAIGQTLKMLPGLGMLAGALETVTGTMKDGIKFGFDYNRTLEESRLSFTRLLGSPGQAEAHIRALQRLRREGIGLEEAAGASRRFQAARFDLEQIPAYIAAVGDAARITGADVDAITRALTQMASKGKVSAEEVNQQLAEQGVPAWRYLADAVAEVDKNFAKLTTEDRIRKVQKMAELGQLSGMGGAQAILRGIQKDFGGFSRQFAEQTATGLEAQLNAAASRLAGTATGPFFERYKALLRGTLEVANSETGNALARGAAASAEGNLRALEDALKTGGDIGSGLIKGLDGSGFKAAAQFIGEFRGGIGAHSPATEFIPIGASAAQGFKIGFSTEMGHDGGVMGLFQGGRGPLGSDVRSKLEAAADDPRVRAFFEAIRRAEGGEPNRIVGGGTFTDFSRHPNRIGFRGPRGPSTAAGSFQITATNWNRIAPILGLTDFAARNQLLAALYLFNEEGGLDRLLAGDVEGAIRAAGRDWAAVPGSPLPGRSVSQASFINNFQQALSGGGGMSREENFFQFVMQDPNVRAWMQRTYGHTGYLPGSRDLQGGYGQFVDGFRDVPEGSGLDDTFTRTGPVIARLDEEIQQVTLDVTKMTSVFMRPLEPLPGAAEGVDELNSKIQQTVPILQKAQKEASFLGITGKDAAKEFEYAWTNSFTRTDLSFKGMVTNFTLTFAQGLNQMAQQWAASQVSGFLSKLIGWGIGAIAGSAAGGLSAGAQRANATFGRPGPSVFGNGGLFGQGAMPKFATGGSFVVKGAGGTDSQLVAFKATPGEEVTVRTPNQRSGATVIHQKITNIYYQPRTTPDSYGTRRSQREGFEGLLALVK